MRPVRSLVLYFIAVFVGGALLAPWLFKVAVALGEHSSGFAHLAANPFHRFVNRAMLGIAVIGLWPLLQSNGMLHFRSLGFSGGRHPVGRLLAGFLLGLGSLALVASIAVAFGGRTFDHARTGAEILRHIFHASVSALIVAVLEELIFRGSLFGILRKATAWPIALVISSAVYALVHFLQGADSPGPVTWSSGLALLVRMFDSGPALVPAVFTLFVAGAILALAYQRTGTLYYSMGLHAGWIFWLKSYGFFTVATPGASAAWWGGNRLIDGWLALPILVMVFFLVAYMEQTERPENAR